MSGRSVLKKRNSSGISVLRPSPRPVAPLVESAKKLIISLAPKDKDNSNAWTVSYEKKVPNILGKAKILPAEIPWTVAYLWRVTPKQARKSAPGAAKPPAAAAELSSPRLLRCPHCSSAKNSSVSSSVTSRHLPEPLTTAEELQENSWRCISRLTERYY
jgi:hypothetical protein